MKAAFVLAILGVVIFCFAGCRTKTSPEDTGMPDPYHAGKWVSVKKVNMTYGTDETRITLYKPHSASFTYCGDDPLNAGKLVSVKANNNSWSADFCGYISYDDDTPGDSPFVDAYYHGAPKDKKYSAYEQEITYPGMNHMGMPVIIIKYSFKEHGDERVHNEYFIGFEFRNTKDGTPHGSGLMGIRFHDFGDTLSESTVRGIFNEMFTPQR